jgi:hypothetical protein
MSEPQTKSSQDEPILEIIADGRDLVPVVTLSKGTTFQVAGWTNELVDLAKAIVDAESKWMPGELVTFANDVLAFRNTKVLPLETDPSTLGGGAEIASEAEFQQAVRARDAMKRFGTLVRGILYEVAKRLEREARELSEGGYTETIQ